ncbi:hypothetical protein DLJ53_04930 [Acuticoccus sediminis]|uniref:Flavodoxin n=1 Tax=Acuticoccus sediminis TaxID=2184697 RepID=A0A8B2P5G1_9HYPH|nr:hypothetical protein [Acuticoccus sediminis]RAI03819.1 hypothetical protein DLJ53_04930 [Acuticoccus sediminis]
MRNLLVVYFSETGHTARAARDVALRLGGDLDRIVPLMPQKSSPLAKAFAALMGREELVHNPARNPSEYAVVVIASPVWAGRLPPPVRGYLGKVKGRLGAVAFLVTCGGGGTRAAFRCMRDAAGRPPIAQVTITDADRRSGMDAGKLATFADMLREERAAA